MNEIHCQAAAPVVRNAGQCGATPKWKIENLFNIKTTMHISDTNIWKAVFWDELGSDKQVPVWQINNGIIAVALIFNNYQINYIGVL